MKDGKETFEKGVKINVEGNEKKANMRKKQEIKRKKKNYIQNHIKEEERIKKDMEKQTQRKKRKEKECGK